MLVDVLREQYKRRWHMTKARFQQPRTPRLQENTFTVTTGHQLCLMTGPLYFIYKIVSTINLCKQLKARVSRVQFCPCVLDGE